MNSQLQSCDITLEPVDNRRLANLCGQFDEHLRQIERSIGVEINNRGHDFRIIGAPSSIKIASTLLTALYQNTVDETLTPANIQLNLQESEMTRRKADQQPTDNLLITTQRCKIITRGLSQHKYVTNIYNNDISFGIGPAGTGKTYLAVACAVEALEKEQVRRLVLVRPAVEAGEQLGFLPGDLAQKIDPYLRPLYDALYEMLGFDKVANLIKQNIIEIAPLAFMRGRTLNDAFVILDEGQNTTIEQMKMFLTRIGFGSKVVVTGDVTQIDLPKNHLSGLRHVVDILKDVDDISFTFFQSSDVVRHMLIQRIVEAYDAHERPS